MFFVHNFYFLSFNFFFFFLYSLSIFLLNLAIFFLSSVHCMATLFQKLPQVLEAKELLATKKCASQSFTSYHCIVYDFQFSI